MNEITREVVDLQMSEDDLDGKTCRELDGIEGKGRRRE